MYSEYVLQEIRTQMGFSPADRTHDIEIYQEIEKRMSQIEKD